MKKLLTVAVFFLVVGGLAAYFPTQHATFKNAYAKGYSIGQDKGYAAGYRTGYDKGNKDGANNTKAAATTFTLPSQTQTPAPPDNGATALCEDGTLSYSANHSGTCSHHGGVSEWYR